MMVSSRTAAAVAVGGAVGAATRFGLTTLWPDGPGFPWTTFVINVTGCYAIGVLIALVGTHPLLRPMLGAGFLGGYTTFSAYAVQAVERPPLVAATYVVVTVVAALAATRLGLKWRS